MERTIDLNNISENIKTNLIPILISITTEEFNSDNQAVFLEKIEEFLNEMTVKEIENLLASAIGQQVLKSVGV